MIVTGKLDRVATLKTDALVSFIIPAYQANYLSELVDEEEYKIEITKVKSKRSLQQNRLLWQMIGQIAKHEGMESIEVYCQIIKMAKIRTIYVESIPEAKAELLKVFRAVVECEVRCSVKGVTTLVMECYYGSSTFTVEEMTEFIDRMLDYAERIGISTAEYDR